MTRRFRLTKSGGVTMAGTSVVATEDVFNWLMRNCGRNSASSAKTPDGAPCLPAAPRRSSVHSELTATTSPNPSMIFPIDQADLPVRWLGTVDSRVQPSLGRTVAGLALTG